MYTLSTANHRTVNNHGP